MIARNCTEPEITVFWLCTFLDLWPTENSYLVYIDAIETRLNLPPCL